MVNNKKNGEMCVSTSLYCIVLTTLFFLIISINSFSQNISKHYTSLRQSKGVLYYILPQNGFKNKDTKNEFIYDITYLTENDSLILNFSYFDKLIREIDSIAIIGGDRKYISLTNKIFIDIKRSKWHYRYSSNFLFNDIKTLFTQINSPTIILYSKQGLIELKIKSKTWRKQSAITNKILTLIVYNK